MKTLLLKIVDSLNLYPLFNRFTKNTATIFMLHGITPSGVFREGAISADVLDGFLGFLKKNNYSVLSLKEYVKALANHDKTYKSVVFTVDDGYRDFYLHAYDVFKKYNYSATIFITSDFIENKLFFWWDTIEFAFQTTSKTEINLDFAGMGVLRLDGNSQKKDLTDKFTRYCKTLKNAEKLAQISKLIQELDVDITGQPKGIYEPLQWDEIAEMKENLIYFYPHTKTHPILSRIGKDEQRVELEVPYQVLTRKLGYNADIFCYPNGQWEDFNEDTISILKSTGYVAAVMGVEGFDHTDKPVDMFRIKRFSIPMKDMLFRQYVCGLESIKRKLLS